MIFKIKNKYFRESSYYLLKFSHILVKNITLAALFSNFIYINANKITENHMTNTIQNEQNNINTLSDIEITQLSKSNIKTNIDFSKSKYNMVVFMASWCPYCILELKDLELKFKEFKEMDVNIIPIFTDLNIEQVIELYSKLNIVNLKDKIFIDKDAETFHKLNLKGFPNSFFTDAKGNIIQAYPRKYIDWKEKDKINDIKKILEKSN